MKSLIPSPEQDTIVRLAVARMTAKRTEVKAKTEKESKALKAALKKRKQERLKSSPKRRRIEGVTYLRADYARELFGQ